MKCAEDCPLTENWRLQVWESSVEDIVDSWVKTA